MNRTQIMAHIIQVPIAVEFAPTSRIWEVCTAYFSELPQVITPALLIPIPFTAPVRPPEPGVRLRRSTPPSMKKLLSSSYYKAFTFEETSLPRLLKEFGERGLQILVSFPHALKPNPLTDPWIMRQEFLQLKHTPHELLRFLNRWGSWGGGGTLNEHPADLMARGNDFIEYAIPEDVWQLQASYKKALAGDAATWLSESGRMPTPSRRSTPPFLASRDLVCTHAILTTITMDKLADAPYRLCERADCGNVFKVESNHSRSYCSQPCAHLVSVRRGRDAKRQAKADAAKEKK